MIIEPFLNPRTFQSQWSNLDFIAAFAIRSQGVIDDKSFVKGVVADTIGFKGIGFEGNDYVTFTKQINLIGEVLIDKEESPGVVINLERLLGGNLSVLHTCAGDGKV
jgi:hypothetical protein